MTAHAPQGWKRAFSIEVRHAGFDDVGASVPVAWQLVEPSPARLSALGLICRDEHHGLSVFGSEGSGGDTTVDLLFQLTATDPVFFAYTDIDRADGDTTLWFDSTTAPAPDGGSGSARRLHEGATVSAADRAARDALPLQRSITQHAPRSLLLGYVRIRWSSADPLATAWFIAFDARAVVWKVSVHGAAGRALFIRDAEGQVDFEPATPTLAPGPTDTVILRSTAAIPFRQHALRHFQLMEVTPHGERLLIHRLPAASPSALAKDTVNGRELTVAEIDLDL